MNAIKVTFMVIGMGSVAVVIWETAVWLFNMIKKFNHLNKRCEDLENLIFRLEHTKLDQSTFNAHMKVFKHTNVDGRKK